MTGILFLRSINWTFGPSSRLFEALCGEKAAVNVIFVTTNWSKEVKMADQSEEAKANEKEFKDVQWKRLINLGATTQRFLDSRESALGIISPHLAKCNRPLQPLLLQEEMVDMGLSLGETLVGRMLYLELKQENEVAQKAGLAFRVKRFDKEMSILKVGYYRRLTLALGLQKTASASIQVSQI